MQTALVAAIDRVIAYFNARRLDLPDGFFDRRTQFVINGAPFETLLGQSPNDPLILMLARGPAGFRFTTKALQHAIPDARIERGEVITGWGSFQGLGPIVAVGQSPGHGGSREHRGIRDAEAGRRRSRRDRRGGARRSGSRKNPRGAAAAVMSIPARVVRHEGRRR